VLDSIRSTIEATIASKNMNNLNAQLEVCDRYFHKECVYRLRLVDALLQNAVTEQHFETALKLTGSLLEIFERVYPATWPLTTVQLAMLGKLFKYFGRLQEAVDTLTKAFRMATVTHGSDNSFCKSVSQLLYEASQDLATMNPQTNLRLK